MNRRNPTAPDLVDQTEAEALHAEWVALGAVLRLRNPEAYAALRRLVEVVAADEVAS